jgi:hypothetical protein
VPINRKMLGISEILPPLRIVPSGTGARPFNERID